MTILTNLGDGTGPDLASDEISGEHHQLVKLGIGAAGTATPVTTAAPVPVRPGTFATLSASRTSPLSSANGSQIASSNSSRLNLTVVNHGTAPVAIVYSAAGGLFTAAPARTVLAQGEEFIMANAGPIWTGVVHAIASTVGTSDITTSEDSP